MKHFTNISKLAATAALAFAAFVLAGCEEKEKGSIAGNWRAYGLWDVDEKGLKQGDMRTVEDGEENIAPRLEFNENGRFVYTSYNGNQSEGSYRKNENSASAYTLAYDSKEDIYAPDTLINYDGGKQELEYAMSYDRNIIRFKREYQPKSVKIGSQTWMAENLNVETPDSWCYDNKPENCAKYGRLYDQDAAMKACPAGWHLPDTSEWNKLVAFAGGEKTASTKLKSKSPDWDGTDEFGFSALPGGFVGRYDEFHSLGEDGSWWTATESENFSYNMNIFTSASIIANPKSGGFSVRCVKD